MNVHITRLRTGILGTIQIAGTSSGIVRIQLDDDGDSMRADLRAQYPDAAFKRPSGMTVEAGHVLRAYLGGGTDPHDVPVVLPEVGFATRVWRQLRRIPYGQVRTYGGVARSLRRARAARAVGQACGRNPVPLVVPCHRVLAADRRLGGFSSGLDVKRALLDLEGVAYRG
jgi:O-6-methylguanine DNA methyltransferase